MTAKTILLALAGCSCSANLATAQNLNLKLGLWEFTSTTESKGDLISMMPAAEKARLEEAKAHMTPEQRAKMEALLKARTSMLGPTATPRVFKSCLTRESMQLKFANLSNSQYDSSCPTTPIRSTSTAFESRQACSTSGVNTNTLIVMEATDPEQFAGNVRSTVSGQNGTFEVRAHTTGKWLGSACGEVKP